MIRTDRIGDVILTLPMVETIKYNFPNAKIDLLVNKRVFELVSDYPNITKVHPIEKESLKIIRTICVKEGYDIAIAVFPSFNAALALYLSPVKYRIGTAYRWYSFLFNIRHYQHRKYSVKHELEYNLDLLDELGCDRPEKTAPELYVAPQIIENVKRKLELRGFDVSEDFIIVHTQTLGSAKAWGRESFIRLIELALGDSECSFRVALTGSKDDESAIMTIARKFGDDKRFFTVLDLDLKELSALIKLSRMFISNSTGPIHIAAAVGTFAVGIYSPHLTESQTRWGPYTEKKKVFTPAEKPGKGDIMDSIRPEDVYAFIRSFMLKKIPEKN